MLIPIVNKQHGNAQIGENATVSLGRLGLMCTDDVAPRLASFAKGWCHHALSLSDKRDKEHAFNGMARMVRANPAAGFNNLTDLLVAASQYDPDDITPALRQDYSTLLNGYKERIAGDWAGYFSKVFFF